MAFALHQLLPLLSSQLGHSAASVPVQALRTYAVAAGSMALVKDLREKSGAPISDVKSALVEANWDPGTNSVNAWLVLTCNDLLQSKPGI